MNKRQLDGINLIAINRQDKEIEGNKDKKCLEVIFIKLDNFMKESLPLYLKRKLFKSCTQQVIGSRATSMLKSSEREYDSNSRKNRRSSKEIRKN